MAIKANPAPSANAIPALNPPAPSPNHMDYCPAIHRFKPPTSTQRLLRLGTHNIHGCFYHEGSLDAKLHAHLLAWQRARLSVVCLQETHVHSKGSANAAQASLDRVAEHSNLPQWTAFWGYGIITDRGAPSAGVAILIRSDLLANNTIRITEPATAPYIPTLETHNKGRLLHTLIEWGGHKLRIASIYLHSGKPAQQQAFINTHLTHLRTLRGDHMWLGDFNFTMDPDLDRLSRIRLPSHPSDTINTSTSNMPTLAPSHPTPHTDRSLANLFNTVTNGEMIDTFRSLHPRRTAFTYYHSTAASRIDRIHTSSILGPYIHSCDIISTTTVSDHRPATLALLACVGDYAPRKERRRRSHLQYRKHPSLCDELTAWLMQQNTIAPSGDMALILWWPRFKANLSAKLLSLNRAASDLDHALSSSIQTAQSRLESALSSVDAGDAEALPIAVEARRHLTSLMASHQRNEDSHRRLEWIHQRERPCPLVTKLTRPPKDSRFIAALRRRDGELETDGKRMAECMIDFWADISKLPQPSTSTTPAQQRVLEAIRAYTSCHIPPSTTTGLGNPIISESEVGEALKASAAGRAPGPDGIPIALYKAYPDFFIPLLSRLYTAISRSHDTPHRFLEGLICSFHKKSDKSLPANYRPITLLGYDYRILAKILATRLLHCLSPVISPEQTAFLRDRRIGDNICLMQLLPHLLNRLNKNAATVFCDFAKAYDTIDRQFLFAIMREMGAGEAFISWAQILLSNTTARAEVNGYISKLRPFRAGTRQGCPLAPLLYLFIAQALTCWIRHCGLGINISIPSTPTPPPSSLPPIRFVAAQYADDTEAFIPSTQQADTAAFLEALATFATATNQHLNLNKTLLLHIGCPPSAPLPSSSNTLTITTRTTALGISIENPIASSPSPPLQIPPRRQTRAPPPPPTIDTLTAQANAACLAVYQATSRAEVHFTRGALRAINTADSQKHAADRHLHRRRYHIRESPHLSLPYPHH